MEAWQVPPHGRQGRSIRSQAINDVVPTPVLHVVGARYFDAFLDVAPEHDFLYITKAQRNVLGLCIAFVFPEAARASWVLPPPSQGGVQKPPRSA